MASVGYKGLGIRVDDGASVFCCKSNVLQSEYRCLGSERANVSSRVSYPALGVRSNVQKGPFNLLPDLYQSIALSMTILELLEHG